MGLQATWELRLKDHAGQQVAIFPGTGRGRDGGGLRSFSFNQRLRTPGGSNVNIYGDDDRISKYLDIDKNLDNQWEFWRNDPLDNSRGFYKAFETFHRGEQLQATQTGVLIYTSFGQGYNVFIPSEVVDFDTGSAEAAKSGDATTIALEYVDENIGQNAGLDRSGLSRVRPGLQVAVSTLAGVNYADDFAGKLLSDVLQNIADFARYEYMIEGAGSATFNFNWRARPYGKDRRPGNAEGNDPVIFQSSRSNLTNATSAKTYLDAITSVAVRGGGSGSVRVVENANDSTALALSPWARRCVTRTARKESSVAALQSIGLSIIRTNESKERVSFTYRQTKTTRYGVDWNVGDFVIVIDDFGRWFDMSIDGVSVAFLSEGVETIIPELFEIIP